MILASCRKNFVSEKFLSADLQFRDYPALDQSTNFSALTLANLQAKARDRHVCLLVHGYSNPLGNVLGAYAELQTRMESAGILGLFNYGLLVGFTWPGWWGPGFPIARTSAERAGKHLRQLVNDLRPAALSIDIQTHSLGARVALAALKPPKGVFVDNLLLSAPAVDCTILQPGREFHESRDACNRCLVYHSRRDAVLKKLFPCGDAADSIQPALGLNGPRRPVSALKQNPNLYVIDCTSCVPDHGGYRKAAQYYAHWSRVLSGNVLARSEKL